MSDKYDNLDIFGQLDAGIWDDSLDVVINSAVARRKYVHAQQGAKNMLDFVPGTKVRLINIRPKYLTGITGVVSTRTANRAGDIMVEVDPSQRHKLGRYGNVLGVPASSLEEVD